MINSRKIEDLHPSAQQRLRAAKHECEELWLDFIVTSTYRDAESQQALYDQGRTKPGRRVTNAKPGQSYHNWRVAVDIVPIRNGKPVWGTAGEDLKLWQAIASVFKDHGFEWAGDWKTFKEFPHFQYTGGLKLADFHAGKTLPVEVLA